MQSGLSVPWSRQEYRQRREQYHDRAEFKQRAAWR